MTAETSEWMLIKCADVLEVEAALQIGAVDCDGSGRFNIVIAVRVVQVLQVHGVLRGFLRMAPEPQRRGTQAAPVRAGGRLLGKVPLRRTAAAAPPGEDHPEDLGGLVDLQLRGFGSGGMGHGHALSGRVELGTVERTHETAISHHAPDSRSQVRPQVRTVCAGHADATLVVAPGDDVLAHPGLLDQPLVEKGLAVHDEVPPLGVGRQIIDGLYGNAKELFGFRETILFYDLTNSFYTGRKKGELLRYGRSKEKRTDCPLVTLALTLDASGFPRTVEILPGNASEPDTLKQAIEKLDGACPTVIMDAGIATAANIAYLQEQRLDWICVARTKTPAPPEREADVDTKGARPVRAWQLSNQDGVLRVYVHSEARKATGDRIRENKRAKFVAAIEKLHAGLSIPKCMKDHTKVQLKVGRLQEKHKRVSYQYKVRVLKKPDSTHAKAVICTHESAYETQTKASGGYVLSTSHTDWSLERVVRTYWRLTEIERTFRSLKSELGLRPIYHSKDARIEAHLFLSVLAYHAVQLIRTKLKQYGIHSSWGTLQFELNAWHRITTVLPETKDRCILLKQDTDLSPLRRHIAQIMGLKPHRYTKKERTQRPHKSVVT